MEIRKSLGDRECAQETLFISKQIDNFKKGMDGFSMNLSKVFFWNETSIWYMNLSDPKYEMTKLGLFVSDKETKTHIKRVRTGSKEDKVTIIVRQSKTSDYVMLWDIEKNN